MLNLNRVPPLIYIFVNHDNHTKTSSKLCINVLFNNYFVVLLLYFYVKKIRLQRIKRYKVRKEMGNDEVEEVTNKKLMDAILDVKQSISKNTDSIVLMSQNLEEIKTQYTEIKRDFISFKANTNSSIKALEGTQQSLAESQDFLSTEFEKFKKTLTETEQRAKSAESEVIRLNADLQIMRKDIQDQQIDYNNLEQYGRRNMLEINNIPENNNEDLKTIITAIAKIINYQNFDYDREVDVAHRLQSKLDIAPIIIKFHNRTGRNKFYENRKNLKDVKVKDLELTHKLTEDIPIFLNESLTIQNRILFKKARGACKSKNYKLCWTTNGKIMCKKTFQSTAIKIKTEEDILTLIK